MPRRHTILSLLLSSISPLAACTNDVCELDMTVAGERYYDIAWDDASCTASIDASWYEHSGPYVAIEHDDQELWVYFDDLDRFTVGTHTASATFQDDWDYWDYWGCQASLTHVEYERWTKHDHWILEGTLWCPSDWSSVWLTDVSFSIYTAAGN